MGSETHHSDLSRWAPAASGEVQMRIDSEALEQASLDPSFHSVRVYRFSPACVSLGRSQRGETLCKKALREAGLSCVTRPTGGRGLFHGLTDLTYSIVVGSAHSLAHQSILESYAEISQAVVRALQSVGVAARFKPGTASPVGLESPGACFEEHLAETIVLDGKKLVGSSQARKRGALLQHGSLPGKIDYSLQARLFRPHDSEGAFRMRKSFVGFEQSSQLPGSVSIQAALAQALASQLDALVQDGWEKPQ